MAMKRTHRPRDPVQLKFFYLFLRATQLISLRVLIGVALLAMALAIGLFEYRNFHEYCNAEGRYLTDQELVNAAIRYEITHPARYYLEQGGRRYGSVAEFFQVNPNCCQLDKTINPSRSRAIWFMRLIGRRFLVVWLWYMFKDEGTDHFTTAHYLVDTCGNVRPAGQGARANLRTGPTINWEGIAE